MHVASHSLEAQIGLLLRAGAARARAQRIEKERVDADVAAAMRFERAQHHEAFIHGGARHRIGEDTVQISSLARRLAARDARSR
jgi:hypothetical protein